jgi:hypothetical protein
MSSQTIIRAIVGRTNRMIHVQIDIAGALQFGAETIMSVAVGSNHKRLFCRGQPLGPTRPLRRWHARPLPLLRECSRDPHEASVDMGDLVLQSFDGEVRIQRADHGPASGTLQHRHGALLTERRDQASFKGMSTAFRTA